MKQRGWGEDYARLEQFFMQRLINVTQDVTKGDMRYLVWQEVIDNNVVLPTNTVVHVWKDGNNFHDELARVTHPNQLTNLFKLVRRRNGYYLS